jgi:hypothetical protein
MTIRIALTVLSLGLCETAVAQRAFQVGSSVGYEYRTSIPSLDGFEPYSSGRTSLYSLEAYVGVPVGWLMVYPTYSYSLPVRSTTVRNLSGDYVPLGYGYSLPTAEDNGTVEYGPDYYDLSSTASLTQESLGAYVMLSIGGTLEIGSGYFRHRKRVTVYSDVLYDQYYFASTRGGRDHYDYWATYIDHTESREHLINSIAVPFVVQWKTPGRRYHSATQIALWRSEGNRSISIKYSLGLNL